MCGLRIMHEMTPVCLGHPDPPMRPFSAPAPASAVRPEGLSYASSAPSDGGWQLDGVHSTDGHVLALQFYGVRCFGIAVLRCADPYVLASQCCGVRIRIFVYHGFYEQRRGVDRGVWGGSSREGGCSKRGRPVVLCTRACGKELARAGGSTWIPAMRLAPSCGVRVPGDRRGACRRWCCQKTTSLGGVAGPSMCGRCCQPPLELSWSHHSPSV